MTHCCFLCRFMESEVELNEAIQEMHVIATVPHLYHILVELNSVQTLLQLLNHENSGKFKSPCHLISENCILLIICIFNWRLITSYIVDITIAVVDLLQEMSDVDALTDSEEGANTFFDSLVSMHWLCATLITAL